METAKRVDKTNYYLDIARRWRQGAPACAATSARSSSKTTRSSPPAMSVHPEEGKTAATWATAPAKNSTSPAASVMSCAARCTAEANAIISAPRSEMIGSTLYLVGLEYKDGSYVQNANPCAMCKRMIINAGIETVVVRDTATEYRTIDVWESWGQPGRLDGTDRILAFKQRPGFCGALSFLNKAFKGGNTHTAKVQNEPPGQKALLQAAGLPQPRGRPSHRRRIKGNPAVQEIISESTTSKSTSSTTFRKKPSGRQSKAAELITLSKSTDSRRLTPAGETGILKKAR